jgi:hypothetical protein
MIKCWTSDEEYVRGCIDGMTSAVVAPSMNFDENIDDEMKQQV